MNGNKKGDKVNIMKKIYGASFIYLILGLIFGVFYREFTVLQGYEGRTQLSVLHTHALVLGTLFFLIVMLIDHVSDLSRKKSFMYWMATYNVGLLGILVTMLIRGMGQVLTWELSGLNHVAGLFHVIIDIAFVWFFIMLGKSAFVKKT